ncbi:uncharacterized protein EAF01_004139 [Botrytis porri]|uniref:uncharacterized protein n=1 Tax=Botrytis porri TaxID=87229 RepID=UPI0019026F2C|nr:uncharacterized protein EAF01_004139 [Botrytis porri]KAF7908384.1 hypothetical protein EAF01_004139 [Botrytis porri]
MAYHILPDFGPVIGLTIPILGTRERSMQLVRSPHHRLIELAKHSKLRLPHVYVQTVDRFKAFGGHNTSASEYRLDEGSYYRLMDRLGLHASNYASDVFPSTLHRPHSTVSVSTPLSSQVPTSSTPQNQSDVYYAPGRSPYGPSQSERHQNGRNQDHKSPNNNMPNWLAILRSWIRPYNGQDRNRKSCKNCKVREISNPVPEGLLSTEPGLSEPPLPYIITLQCTV